MPFRSRNLKRFDYADTLYLHIRALKLPVPEREYRFHPTRRWRFDLCWPDRKLAVEANGGQRKVGGGRHGGSADYEKMQAAVIAGWRVLQFTGQQIKSGAAIKLLESVLQPE